jgi:hypothetical protein
MGCYLYLASDPRMPNLAREQGWIKDVTPESERIRRRQVAMVSWTGDQVDAFALMTRERGALTFKVVFRLSDFRRIFPLRLQWLKESLPAPHDEDLQRVIAQEGGQLPDEIVAELTRVFTGEDRQAWEHLVALAAADPPELWHEARSPIPAYEREAIGLALGLAGLDRDPVMRDWTGVIDKPFLTSLKGYKLLEDRAIEHDARVFGGWQTIGSSVVGATRFEEHGRAVTVINVNRSKLEETLGCDLIYYNEYYDAYVLVQYKRMRRGHPTWEYRPDARLAGQLERMRAISKSVAGADASPRQHRFGPDFCFLKLCKPEVEDLFSREMAEGMYLPLSLWDKLTASQQLLGRDGGTVVTYENIDRYLTNTHFIDLVERSWLGSSRVTSAQIGEIVEAALAGDEAVVLASSAGGPVGRRSAH